MTGLSAGSHLKNSFELALAISMESDFNVTFLAYSDYKLDFPETDSLHILRVAEL